MRMLRPFALICLLLLPTTVFADNATPAPDGRELLYAPPADSSIFQNLKVELLDVTMSGASTYMTGTASAKVLLKFSDPPPPGSITSLSPVSSTVMTVTVSKMQSQTMGEQHTVTGPEVIQVTVDDRGRAVGYQVKERLANADASAIATADALAALAIFAVLPPLPADPVAPGSEWHWKQVMGFVEVDQVTSDMQRATVDMQCRLIDISEEQIVIESSGKVTMPEAQMPNPFDPSGTIKATDLNLTISRLRQVCQPGTLVVSQAQCEAMATFVGEQQPGYTLPLGVKFKFSVRPLPPPAPE